MHECSSVSGCNNIESTERGFLSDNKHIYSKNSMLGFSVFLVWSLFVFVCVHVVYMDPERKSGPFNSTTHTTNT